MGTEFETTLTSLRNQTSSDFSALASFDKVKREIRWIFVSGNKNERYKKMMLKPGVGIAGKVIRFGHTIVIDKNVPDLDNQRLNSPIMLAEELCSVVAVPVMVNNKISAVLLVGHRSDREYTENDIDILMETSEYIGSLMKKKIFTHTKE
ncbi:GAF domain-containing protein [Anaerobacillus sp. MEB173]|uniref:GAF domain-containing protein n=1 Tax=Anaerobacillus sp. MEB173 TaxID=3383345 RepID=UPI003F925E62